MTRIGKTCIATVIGTALAMTAALAGCDTGVSTETPTSQPTSATLGNYTVTKIGTINFGTYSREMVEVRNAKTGRVTVLIRGFGVADEYQSGKNRIED